MADGLQTSHLGNFFRLLRLDATEVVIISCYSLGSGVVALAVPLAAQALVNNIAQGLFLQPLVILTVAVFSGLLLAGILKALQFALAEAVQQRLFARLGLRLSELVPRFQTREFIQHHGPEELNKFFEVVNVQKSWNKLLLDIPLALVEIVLSFFFLAFYGPTLMVTGLAGLAVGAGLISLLGWGGLYFSIKESKAKYALAGWLEQMSRCQSSLKLNGHLDHYIEHSDALVETYLKYRQAHFRVLLRQQATYYVLNAMAASAILGYGGWLVIQREISLGQLVAAEIVVLGLLKACEKLVKGFDSLFDLLTGLDKLKYLLELPAEDLSGGSLPAGPNGCQLEFRDVSFSHPGSRELLHRASLKVRAGQRISVVGEEGCGRSSLAELAVGLLRPDKGQVELDGVDLRTLSYDQRAVHFALLNDTDELLDTTIEDNIKMGRTVNAHDLRWALELSGLHDHLGWLPDGLKTKVQCGGRNLSRSQVQRVIIARILVDRPSVLVIDKNLYTLEFERRVELARALFDRKQPWTIVNFVVETETLALSDRIYWLDGGQIIDVGTPAELVEQESPFTQRFPTLVRRLKTRMQEVVCT